MPFDINEFSQNISEFGVVPKNKFDVSVSLPPIIQNLVTNASYPFLSSWNTLNPMRILACTTPGVVLMNHETHNLGVGKKIVQPYNAAFTPLRMVFLADSQGIIEQTFNLWYNMAFQYSFDGANLSTFMANYRSQTVSPLIKINKYDRSGNIVNTYNVVGALPLVLSNQQLDWNDDNTMNTINITFDYTSYTIQ